MVVYVGSSSILIISCHLGVQHIQYINGNISIENTIDELYKAVLTYIDGSAILSDSTPTLWINLSIHQDHHRS